MPQGAWSVQDGILKCSGVKKDARPTPGCPRDRKYGDFELTFEWRVQKDANTGVFLRVPERQGRASMTGIEVQIRDDSADKDLRTSAVRFSSGFPHPVVPPGRSANGTPTG